MSTVSDFLSSARYDLNDPEKGIMFDDEELLDYLNRMVAVLDSNLSAMGSDLVEGKDTSLSTTASQDYVDISGLNSGDWLDIRQIFLTSGPTELYKKSVSFVRYQRMYNTGSGKPYYWALRNETIIFDRDADDTYGLTIFYDKKTSTLSISDNMPYNGRFDNLLREMMVMHAKAKSLGLIGKAEELYHAIFRNRVAQEVIRRNFIPKENKLDF